MKSERIKHVEERPARGEIRAEDRPRRTGMNDGGSDILVVKGLRPGFHPCWVNEDRVPRYLDKGYTFVESDVSFGSHHVNQGNPLGARYARNVGSGVTAYLMELPVEYYDEDRRIEEEERRATEEGLKQSARQQGLDHGDLQLPNGRIK